MIVDIDDREELAKWTWEAITAAMDYAPYEKGHIRYKGNEILCDTEIRAEAIGDFLEALGFFYVRTGYYDPVEDERNGEVDDYTGWYYVDFD